MSSDSATVTALATRPTDKTDQNYRVLPHNYEAEQALLGSLLVSNHYYEQVCEFLHPDHFADPVHGRVYDAIGKVIDRGQIASPVTLKGFFDQDPALQEVGGAKYLVQLAQSIVAVVNAVDYAKLVYDLYLRRQLIALGEEVVNEAYEQTADTHATEQIELAEQRLYDLATSGDFERDFRSFEATLKSAMELAEAAHKREGGLAGLTTGFADMDRLLGGLHKSDLIILAGRPSMGKTALATNIAFSAARAKNREGQLEKNVVAFFSLEMSAEQLANRLLADASEINSSRIQRGELKNDEFLNLVRAAQEVSNLSLFIDDSPSLSISGMRTRARRLKRRHGLSLIVVDYLQLLRGTALSSQSSRVNEISEISRGLKMIAKELQVPVLALSQLSRAVEQREDNRPMLSDLRESGSIEQDADVVMFVYREEYYVDRKKPTSKKMGEDDNGFANRLEEWARLKESVKGKTQVIVSKQRHGPIGDVTLLFNSDTTKFTDYIDKEFLPDVR